MAAVMVAAATFQTADALISVPTAKRTAVHVMIAAAATFQTADAFISVPTVAAKPKMSGGRIASIVLATMLLLAFIGVLAYVT